MNQIKEDAKIASKIIDTVEKIATLDDVGIQDFFKQTGQSVDQYNAYKKLLMENPQLAEKLQDSNLSLEEKQIYANQMLKALENELGYSLANGVKVISTDETGVNSTQVKGYISLENDTIYSNDKNQDSTKDTIYTLGQEFAGAIQNANGIDITQNRDVHNEYQNAIAQDTVNDMSFILNNLFNSYLSDTNNHNTGIVTTEPSIFNKDNSWLVNNNNEFASLDKSNGDDLPVFVIPVIIGMSVGGGIEFGMQTVPQVVGQLNDKGWQPKNINVDEVEVDWFDVGMMTAIGAVAPSGLGAAKSVYNSSKAIVSLKKQKETATAITKINKLDNRIDAHTNNIIDNVVTQGMIAGGKIIVKELDEKKVGNENE